MSEEIKLSTKFFETDYYRISLKINTIAISLKNRNNREGRALLTRGRNFSTIKKYQLT